MLTQIEGIHHITSMARDAQATDRFITDTLGFLLFVPAIRDAGWKFLRSRIVILGGPASAGSRHANPHGRDTGPQTIDLSADDYSESGDENSPWRKPDRE